tara:strand:- start:1348 stop:2103 length:756 start_codon:yes stop_codon:yes gene_type:complete
MRKKILFILLLLISNLFGSIDSDSIFLKSNDLYNDDQFKEAIDGYTSLLGNQFSNATLCYNIGNCYYRLGQLGYARLYYEKAKLHTPTDDDIIHNIGIIEEQLVDEVKVLPVFFIYRLIEKINLFFSSSQWAYLMILFLYFNLFLLLIFLFPKSLLYKLLVVRVACVTIPLFCLILFFFSYSNSSNKHINAILVSSNAYIKTAPSKNSDDYFIIHEGVKFQIVDNVDDWSRILLPDGKDGWVENNKFLKIE